MMKILPMGLAVAVLVASLAARADPSVTNKCVLRQVGELAVSMDGGDPVIQAAVNGQSVAMVANTGSSSTSLGRKAAAKLGLSVKTLDYVKLYEGNGAETVGEARVKDFKVGPLEAKNIDLMVSGSSEYGELGIQFLRQSDVEFDFPEGKIRFFKPEGCAGDQVVYWGKSYAVAPIRSNSTLGDIVVEVNVSGQPILAEMASGGGRSIISPVGARLAVTTKGAPATLGSTAVPGEVATFASFSFGDETIHNAKIGVADVFRKDREALVGSRIASEIIRRPDMVLGFDFFRAHRIYVSKSQNKVYVSYMGGPVFDTRRSPSEAAGSTPPH